MEITVLPAGLSINIRPFEPSDVDRTLEIRNTNLRNMIDGDNYPEAIIHDMIERVTKEIVTNLASQAHYSIVVAEIKVDEKPLIVGTGALCEEKTHEAALRLLFVDPAYQQNGVGKTILKNLEKLAKEKQITKLTAKSSVHTAEHFYPKYGYSRDGEETGNMGRVILMSKTLS